MIDVVIADHQELFRAGLVEVLSVADDIRVVAQPQSPHQLLVTLKEIKPQVLILSTNFLPVFPKIRRMLRRRKTALLLLAEGSDRIADYLRWLQSHWVVYRSMGGSVFLDAMRRVARAELFIQRPELRREKRRTRCRMKTSRTPAFSVRRPWHARRLCQVRPQG